MYLQNILQMSPRTLGGGVPPAMSSETILQHMERHPGPKRAR